MSRLSLLIDVNKCSGCYNCFLACRDEHFGNDYPTYSAAQPAHDQFWMQIKEVEQGEYPKPKVSYIPTPCMHCQDASCLDAAKDGAVYRREDGIVMIDPQKAKGQKQIVDACPYRVVFWNEEAQLPQKCNMCAHRLDEGEKMPRCAESCPTGALMFGDLDDPESEIAKFAASSATEEFRPEFGTLPSVKYIGLPKPFVTGEVVFKGKDEECAEGVTVKLNGAGETRTVTTDMFGDFEFKGLKKNQVYTIEVSADGYGDKTVEFTLSRDIDLGEVILEAQ